MPGIQAKSKPPMAGRKYPPDARDAARAVRQSHQPWAEAVAGGFEHLSKSVEDIVKALQQSVGIEELLVTDQQTGRVLAALGEYEKSGIQYSGIYGAEAYLGDPYGDSDPADAILSVTRDGKVTVGQNGWIDVLDPFGASAAWIGTQADYLEVTGAADNGSGLIRLTVTAHTLATGDSARVWEVGGVPNATGVFTVTKIDANHIDLQNSVWDGTYTSGGYVNRVLHVTGAADNGSGKIRLTVVAHGYESGDKVNVASVGGVANATGQHIIAVIDADHFDLVGSTWAGGYTSGGIVLRYFAGGLFQTVAIGPSFADYRLRAFADGTLRIRNAEIELTGTGGTITLDPANPAIRIVGTGSEVISLDPTDYIKFSDGTGMEFQLGKDITGPAGSTIRGAKFNDTSDVILGVVTNDGALPNTTGAVVMCYTSSDAFAFVDTLGLLVHGVTGMGGPSTEAYVTYNSIGFDGVQVIGPQLAAISAPTGGGTAVSAPSGGAVIDAQARAAINSIITAISGSGNTVDPQARAAINTIRSRMSTHGLTG